MTITVETAVDAPIDAVWRAWTTPEDIVRWNAASDDWHTTSAEIDLRVGGRFNYRMAAKDGSMAFDFEGTFTHVSPHERIEYALDDGRRVSVVFDASGEGVTLRETFEAEPEMDREMQRAGWQAILDRFARHVSG